MNEVSQPDNFLRTSEFPVAVTLLCCDFDLRSYERDPQSPNKLIFLFEDSPEARQIIEDYWNDSKSLRVSPKRWHGTSRELKSRVKSVLAADNLPYRTPRY